MEKTDSASLQSPLCRAAIKLDACVSENVVPLSSSMILSLGLADLIITSSLFLDT